MTRHKERYQILTTAALALLLFLIGACVSVHAQTTSTIDGETYTHPAEYQDDSRYLVFDGIDVSNWQGSINWKKVKADGVDFAFIRCGYTTSDKEKRCEDSRAEEYVINASKAGVNIGLYYFALPRTKAQARAEARFMVNFAKRMESEHGIRVSLPLVMDDEFLGDSKLNSYYDRLVKKKGKAYARKVMTRNAMAFMNVVRDAGYQPMFYTYLYIVSQNSARFQIDEIVEDNLFWLAVYNELTNYSGKIHFWQYSSHGSVSGISGRTDRDFYYYDKNGQGMKAGTKDIRDCTISLKYNSLKYNGKPRTNPVTVMDGDTVLTEGQDYTVEYYRNTKGGTAYAVIRGIGSYSSDVAKSYTIKKPAPLAQVTGLKVSRSVSQGKATLRFNSVSGATSYRVRTKIPGKKATTKTYKTTTPKITVTGLTKGTLVSFQVRALGKNTSGDYSDPAYCWMQKASAKITPSLKAGRFTVKMTNVGQTRTRMYYKIQTAGMTQSEFNAAAYTGRTTFAGTSYKARGWESGTYCVKFKLMKTVDGNTYVGPYCSKRIFTVK
ncbi:MAG: GH25 family lysozyme [Anaerovoracaceae bacterium]|jgi:GH25 family lysozyme M1 (1,4-beta-N-acetylmuramidase)